MTGPRAAVLGILAEFVRRRPHVHLTKVARGAPGGGVDTRGGGVVQSAGMAKKPTFPKISGLRGERKSDVLNRLKTVRGMTDGIYKMVDEDVYCVQVIKQISAARASLDRVARIMLENHVETCFAEQMRAGEGAAAVAELMETLSFQRELI